MQKAVRSLASLRSTVMAAPLHNILKTLSEDSGPQSPQSTPAKPTALLYRPKEVFYVTNDVSLDSLGSFNFEKGTALVVTACVSGFDRTFERSLDPTEVHHFDSPDIPL